MKKRLFISTILFVGICMAMLLLKYSSIIKHYKEKMKNNGWHNQWTFTQPPFYNTKDSKKFMFDEEKDLNLKLWWESLTGDVEVTITDEKGNQYFTAKNSQINNEYSIALEKGKYNLDLQIHNFSGAIVLGANNIVTVKELPKNNYRVISRNPSQGFYWEYILYIPNEVTNNNLLVVPNNTGTVSDNIDLHKEEAKSLILRKSKLAEELGVPLLVPVFPRPENHEELYTHALDRAAILTSISELNRLDLQLIAMIEDSKRILSKKGINLDEKILISGFSASGDFADRFTFLHPKMVKAASIGGSDNMVPCKSLNGENLPYPIGIYDYEEITGKKFDIHDLSDVYRFIYKGSEDEGGWYTWKDHGEVNTYTGKEYYEKCRIPQLIEDSDQLSSPVYISGDLTNREQDQIVFRAYDKKILMDRFLIIKSIFSELKLDKNEFIVYNGVGHTKTKEIQADELQFFVNILGK